LAESRGLFEVALVGLETFGVDRKAIGSEGKVGEAEQAGVAAQRGAFASCERVPELLWAPARAKPEGSKTWTSSDPVLPTACRAREGRP